MTTPPEPVDSVAIPEMASLGEPWVPLPVAAHRLGISVKTLRRRIKAGEVEAQSVHDPAIGGDRWMVKAEEPAPTSEVMPVEMVAKLEEAWQKVVELTGRAEVAETILAFERERRERAEAEVDRMRLELTERQTPEPAPVERRRWWQRKS